MVILRIFVLICVLLLLTAGTSPAWGFSDTIFVAQENAADTVGAGTHTSPYLTIQYALDNSDNGYLILVGPGIYNESITFPSWVVELRSEKGPDSTTIDGSGHGTPVNFTQTGLYKSASIEQSVNSVLDGFTITCPTCDDTLQNAVHGGISISYDSPVIRNNKIINNRLDPLRYLLGGGIYISGGDPEIYNNIIGGNLAAQGGGIFVGDFSKPNIYNNTIVGNTISESWGGGAGIHIAYDGDATIKNNIIAFNGNGFGIYSGTINFMPVLSNTLFYENSGGHYDGSFSFGGGLVFADPAFVDYEGGDYHLVCNSEAINAGDLGAIDSSVVTDLEGNPRVEYTHPDLGALEFIDDHKQAGFIASDTAGCAPLTVSFDNTSTCIDEEWHWDFGDGGIATTENPSHEYEEPGVYHVTLQAYGKHDSDTLTRSSYITVYGPLDVDVEADVVFGCAPVSVTFTAVSDGLIRSYSWDFGDGGNSIKTSPMHVYHAAGRHTVTLIATNPCGVDTVVKEEYIWVEKTPSVEIISSYDSLGGELSCSPFEVRFYTVSDDSLEAFEWDFGDNHFSTERDPVNVYTEGGTYSVRLVATGLCGTTENIRQKYITVLARPGAEPETDISEGCVPLSVLFDANTTGSIDSLRWHFGDGLSSSAATVSHTYADTGEYHATLVIHHQCGTDMIDPAETIIVRDRPVADFACPATVGYVPYEVGFIDNSTNQPSGWSWDFGDGGTSDMANPTHTYMTTGLFTVSLTAANACGTGSTLARPECVTVGGFQVRIDQPSQAGDTIIYPVIVDTVLLDYPNQVYLKAVVQETPYRGSLSAALTSFAGRPPYTSELLLVPSGDLPSGVYTVGISAVDSVFDHLESDAVVLEHLGRTILALNPDTLNFDSVVTGATINLTARILNDAPAGSEFSLTIQSAHVEGEAFSIEPFENVTIPPGWTHAFTVSFSPDDRIVYTGIVRVQTNDPVVRDTSIFLMGRGIPEQKQPAIASTRPDSGEVDVLISDTIVIAFSEPVVVDTATYPVGPLELPPAMSVRSGKLGQYLPGQLYIGTDTLAFVIGAYWRPFDTISVWLVADRIIDTVFNRLDGDGDGLEEGSPVDDYRFIFVTGPGVFPGNTDGNMEVDERDVLPLGRFWEQTGPSRPLEYESFTIQPAHLWPDSAATYADADGNGIVDSLDVCPILEFWTTAIGSVATHPDVERNTRASQTKVQAFWEEMAEMDMTVLRSIYNAIDNCPEQTGAASLKEMLSNWLEQENDGPPATFGLFQNYPNPFNAQTVITFTLPAPAEVELVIFNTKGEKVAVPAMGYKSVGRHVVIWDGRTADGKTAASGMYFYRLQAGDFRQTRKMTLIK